VEKKKIILAAGIYPPQIGGPAKYVKNLNDEFWKKGYTVSVVTFKFESKLPSIIRHVFYFFRLFLKSITGEVIIAFDTFSTGFPAIMVSKILRKKIIIRVGGDFLWENHVERKWNKVVPLPVFYENRGVWSIKDRAIFFITNFVLINSDKLVFNSVWLRDIFLKNYSLKFEKTAIIQNVFEKKAEIFNPESKTFFWAGRPMVLKNVNILDEIFLDIKKSYPDVNLEIATGLSNSDVIEKIKKSYALVLPSISDVMPNFIFEGLEYRKPFVATKFTGLVDDWVDCGEFVDPLDRESIKRGIENLLSDQKYLEYQNNISKKNIRNSWANIANDFINLIQST
jgi:glycosyltransferase involved in cell wall biosynthesis